MKRAILALVLICATGCRYVDYSTGQLRRMAGARAFWSFLLPGVGQIMNDQPGKGAMLVGLEVVNHFTYADPDQQDRWVTVMSLLRLWGATDAYDVAKTLNETTPLPHVVPDEGGADAAPADEGVPLVFILDPWGRRLIANLCYRF